MVKTEIRSDKRFENFCHKKIDFNENNFVITFGPFTLNYCKKYQKSIPFFFNIML